MGRATNAQRPRRPDGHRDPAPGNAAEYLPTLIVLVLVCDALDLARELAALRARASARKDPDPVTVRVDPPDPTA